MTGLISAQMISEKGYPTLVFRLLISLLLLPLTTKMATTVLSMQVTTRAWTEDQNQIPSVNDPLLSLQYELQFNLFAIWDSTQLLQHYPELGGQAMWLSALISMVSQDMDALVIRSAPSFFGLVFERVFGAEIVFGAKTYFSWAMDLPWICDNVDIRCNQKLCP